MTNDTQAIRERAERLIAQVHKRGYVTGLEIDVSRDLLAALDREKVLEAEVAELKLKLEPLEKYMGDCIEEGIQEAKEDADHFDKDLWVLIRKLLDKIPGFDWSDYQDGIDAEAVYEYLTEHLRQTAQDFTRYKTTSEARLATLQPIAAMLELCGEREVRDMPGATADKFRALIDGLIDQRKRAEAAEAQLAILRQQIADEELYRKIKTQIERGEFQYRVEESPEGFEPQMLYTLGRLDGFAWFPLTANGYWSDPDAFTDGEIKIRSFLPSRDEADRAIVCARRVNGEKLISAALPASAPKGEK